MRTSARTLAFVLANTIAVLLALYLSFASDLERPYWSMFTVFVVAKPIAGAVRSKAVFRLIGTLIGAGLSLLMIPPLVQAPVLLCTATSLWIALCVYLALLDRRPRNYAFLLAGYTTTIVGLAVVNAPETIFDTSVARLEEISLGLVCAAVAHSVIFPQSILDELLERADRALRKCAAWLAEAISRPASVSDVQSQQQLAAFVSDLHVLYDHVAFEISSVPREAGLMRALQDRFAWLLPRVSGVQQALVALTAEKQLSPAAQEAIAKASQWARTLSRPDVAEAELRDSTTELRAACARLAAEPLNADTWSWALRDSIAAQLPRIVDDLLDAGHLVAAIKGTEGAEIVKIREQEGSRRPRSMHRDRGLAVLSAGAAATATLVACALWIEGSWPEGGVAAQFAAIGCSLFATLDRPSKVIFSAIVGILVALPLAALYQFALFPRIDGFALLALVLLPPVLLFSWMQTSERLEGAALVLAIAFSGGLALQSSYQPDFAAFINSNTAEVAGLLIAAITNLIFRTIDPIWNALRISRAGWRSVMDLARRPKSDIEQWVLEMFDRLGLVTGRLVSARRLDLIGPRVDVLRDIRVGINVISLEQSSQQLNPALQSATAPVMSAVGEAYQGLARGRSLPDSRSELTIDVGIAALSGQTPSPANQGALRALVGLRLDLAAFGSRYQSNPAIP
jgi:uncharacterized membrane protein YccC